MAVDTSNLKLDYFTDSVTFSQKLILIGADPSHTNDLKKFGGTFQSFLLEGKRGWIFSPKQKKTLEAYINTGKVSKKKAVAQNVMFMSRTGKKKDLGKCNICNKKYRLDVATKEYVMYYTGGLPKQVVGPDIADSYREKIRVAFGSNGYTCIKCIRKNPEF